ncbi:hypothetical protein AXE80_10765 [Wenyingzhuangia fucanilytica]|uniref:Uncharacterized protein n=1 Tax=Wenyingzhuangia fucanilytica TaxID=1790137 RepID=A0A1B1Y7I1_9FLAO|nr:hypothetical protein [Wenyingzhuangia fucanilytica]ANW96725.1 hypothetical protein AXE80_10765 [Wenyingzhuangia fucanilytica]
MKIIKIVDLPNNIQVLLKRGYCENSKPVITITFFTALGNLMLTAALDIPFENEIDRDDEFEFRFILTTHKLLEIFSTLRKEIESQT